MTTENHEARIDELLGELRRQLGMDRPSVAEIEARVWGDSIARGLRKAGWTEEQIRRYVR